MTQYKKSTTMAGLLAAFGAAAAIVGAWGLIDNAKQEAFQRGYLDAKKHFAAVNRGDVALPIIKCADGRYVRAVLPEVWPDGSGVKFYVPDPCAPLGNER